MNVPLTCALPGVANVTPVKASEKLPPSPKSKTVDPSHSTLPQPPAISFTDLQGVVGFPDYWAKETKYQAKE